MYSASYNTIHKLFQILVFTSKIRYFTGVAGSDCQLHQLRSLELWIKHTWFWSRDLGIIFTMHVIKVVRVVDQIHNKSYCGHESFPSHSHDCASHWLQSSKLWFTFTTTIIFVAECGNCGVWPVIGDRFISNCDDRRKSLQKNHHSFTQAQKLHKNVHFFFTIIDVCGS